MSNTTHMHRLRRWLHDWRSYVLALLILAIGVWALDTWRARHQLRGPAPEFSAELAGVSGTDRITLEGWRAQHPGRAVALYFWAEWCPYCRAEEGSISALQQDWPVLTVATLRSGNAAQVARLLQKRQLTWLTAVDAEGSLLARYGQQGVPALVVLDAKGHIRHISIGNTPEWLMRLRLWRAQNF